MKELVLNQQMNTLNILDTDLEQSHSETIENINTYFTDIF